MLPKRFLSFVLAALLLLPLGACQKAPAAAPADDWFLSLQFQEMTREELAQTLLDRGWVSYRPELASDEGDCYVGTLFDTKAVIFCAGVNPETGLVTGLYLYSFQYPSDVEEEAQERLAAVEDGLFNKLRAAQPRPGTASEAAAAWATAVRKSLARTGAVLSEKGDTLPGGADSSQQALQEELFLYLDSGAVFTAARKEGVYRFPDGRLTLLSLLALPREDGTGGMLNLCLFLLTDDYRTVDGAVPALPGT